MSNSNKSLWTKIKQRGEDTGIVLLPFGFILLLLCALLTSLNIDSVWLLGISIGVMSLGLGFIALGISAKSDERYTQLLEKLNKNIAYLPRMFKGDTLSTLGQQVAEEAASEQSKTAAQERLDQDRKKVGYLRGEIYKVDDENWAINWGGKYPL